MVRSMGNLSSMYKNRIQPLTNFIICNLYTDNLHDIACLVSLCIIYILIVKRLELYMDLALYKINILLLLL